MCVCVCVCVIPYNIYRTMCLTIYEISILFIFILVHFIEYLMFGKTVVA